MKFRNTLMKKESLIRWCSLHKGMGDLSRNYPSKTKKKIKNITRRHIIKNDN